MRCLTAVVLCVAAVAAIRADILPPGSRSVNHIVRFENIAEHPRYVFYVYPRDLSRAQPGNSSIRVPQGGEVSIGGLNPMVTVRGLFLFAVPRSLLAADDAPPREEWFEGRIEGVLKSGPLVRPVRSVAATDPRDRVVTRYRIDIGDELKLVDVSAPAESAAVEAGPAAVEPAERRRWHWIVGGAATGAALACAAFLVWRRKV